MPSRQIVEALIQLVEQGKFVEAIENFYAPDATMQENTDPPRMGLPALVHNERNVMGTFKSIRGTCARPIFVEGDHVVINWRFVFTLPDGRSFDLDELTHQRWSGEKIAQERFYYDPKQMRP